MKPQALDYTFFPWMDSMTVGRVLPVAIGVLVAYCIFDFFFRKFNNNVRKGTMSIISGTVWTLILNVCFFTIAYWQWGIVFSLAMALFFMVIMRHELKIAHQDELEGFRGTNPLIRGIRAEIFSDLSIEEQMAFKKTVVPQKVIWWIWIPLMVLIPFLIVQLLEILGVGDYLFEVVQLKPKTPIQ